MKQVQWKMDSTIGPLYLVASEKGLRGVFWKKQKVPTVFSLKENSVEVKFLLQTVKELEEFLSGKRQKFEMPLDVAGTTFQKSVWKQLSLIPFGETKSYKDIAVRLKSNAIRAIGSANGRNPLSIIVPCHRVIGSNGSLTGYSGGLHIKKKLLDLEQLVRSARK